MQIKCFKAKNFRRLKDVRVDLDGDTTIFVGANNSGKTSATHLFQLFLGDKREKFTIYDFTADCWSAMDRAGVEEDASLLPTITFDLWFDVDENNLHRVIDLLPDLSWANTPVGVRLSYAPRNAAELFEGYRVARAKSASGEDEGSAYKPWPQNMTEYLKRRLVREYEIQYAILDYAQADKSLEMPEGYAPFALGANPAAAAKMVNSLVRVDYLNAQRHLTDEESHGRFEDLSRRLGRFYSRNLDQREDDLDALRAISDSESRLNTHYAEAFRPIMESLGKLGYPGFGSQELVVRATINATSLLNSSARVHYAVPMTSESGPLPGLMLPDQYNGLGFKNLIFMVVEILDFHEAWQAVQQDRPPIHLVMIEEPEAHLHAQLQQIFIRKILEVLPTADSDFRTQLVVTTHSSHILYERDFQAIRYFRRTADHGLIHCSEVRNLSVFHDGEEEATRSFLLQYLKLTHCDLFFADAAILVEGNVERLLLPLIIQKDFDRLRSCHLTILEVGGAFAHKFEQLLTFLQLPTLIITDLDSCEPKNPGGATVVDGDEEEEEDEEDEAPEPSEMISLPGESADPVTPETTRIRFGKACPSDIPGALTSNATLRTWLPKMTVVSELLDAVDEVKHTLGENGKPLVRVAYQSRLPVKWREEQQVFAGRTLEEAFAYENLEWCQTREQKLLQLCIKNSSNKSLGEMKYAIHEKVRKIDKTQFALALMAANPSEWRTPSYISDGLTWLLETLDAAPTTPREVEQR